MKTQTNQLLIEYSSPIFQGVSIQVKEDLGYSAFPKAEKQINQRPNVIIQHLESQCSKRLADLE